MRRVSSTRHYLKATARKKKATTNSLSIFGSLGLQIEAELPAFPIQWVTVAKR